MLNGALSEKPILRLLRCVHSQQYFTGNGWTNDPKHARIFQDSLEAAQTCAEWGLKEVELVLRLTNGSSDLFCALMR